MKRNTNRLAQPATTTSKGIFKPYKQWQSDKDPSLNWNEELARSITENVDDEVMHEVADGLMKLSKIVRRMAEEKTPFGLS